MLLTVSNTGYMELLTLYEPARRSKHRVIFGVCLLQVNISSILSATMQLSLDIGPRHISQTQ